MDAVDAHRPGDVFETLLAHVDELGIDLAAHLAVGIFRDANATGFGNALQPTRDIDPVAVEIAAFNDDVAEIEANPEGDAVILCDAGVSLGHPVLNLDCAANRVHDARELGQEAIAGVFHGPTPVLGDLRLD